MSKTPEELARRTPPGQVLTTKWPVLTYGRTPRFDPRKWSFRAFGLVEEEVSFSWEELQALPRVEVACDIHCVTRWSRLDNRFEGVSIREIVRRVLAGGRAWVGATTFAGQEVVRICATHGEIAAADIDELVGSLNAAR